MTPRPQICLAHGPALSYSETFIRSIIKRLPARVHVAAGVLPTLKKPAIQQFADDLQANNISLVLAEYGPTGVTVMEVCEQLNIPLVVRFHGYDAYRHSQLRKYHTAYPALFDTAREIICVSNAMREQLLGLGAPPEKLHTIPSGVDTTLFHGGNPHRAEPLFVSVGRFVDKKAPQLTLLAFHQLLRQCPRARLVMIGEGPLHDACVRMARALHIEAAVTFPGVLPPEQIAEQLRNARAFVQHSLVPGSGDSEGSPNAVMEAGATGIPVIATRHAGIPEIVSENISGLLVAEGDIDAMSAAMLTLAENGDLARTYGTAGRQKIRAEYDVGSRSLQLWHILEPLIRSTPANGIEIDGRAPL